VSPRRDRVQPDAKRRAHPGLPARIVDERDLAECRLGADPSRFGADDDQNRGAATIAQHGDGALDEQPTIVVADKRLRPAVPASAAGREHQSSDLAQGPSPSV
jgi:hypothetical protein